MTHRCNIPLLPFKKGDEVKATYNKNSNTYTVDGISVVGIIAKEEFEEKFIEIRFR